MSWPVRNNGVACIATFQAPSGLPTDVFSNTFYFVDQGVFGIPNVADSIETVLTDFYKGTNGSNRAVVDNYPQSILAQDLTLKCYDLSIGPPRNPFDTRIVDMTGEGSASLPLPREAALVLSYYAGRTVGEPAIDYKRRRGRLYLGPFTVDACEPDSSPVGSMRQAVADAAERLRTTGVAVNWMQCSPTNGDYHIVTGGWVDNAWDTQRSRGEEPTLRTTWGDPLAT